MTATEASGAPQFKLKSPTEYFSESKSLSLLDAAMAGDLPKAKYLVAEGADPNDEGPRSNQYNRLRLLHYAIAANNKQAVEILVAVGADPELSVLGFGRAFSFALTLKNMPMLSLLLDLRPIPALSRETIYYLLFDSVEDNCRTSLEMLFKRGAPIDFTDGAGYTLLMSAMDFQDYDLAEWLLQKGASVHIDTTPGVTPAYAVEFHLKKFKPGSPTYNKVLHLKNMMAERGAVFPALTPEEVKAKRGNH